MVCMDSQKAECKVFLKSDHKIKEKGRCRQKELHLLISFGGKICYNKSIAWQRKCDGDESSRYLNLVYNKNYQLPAAAEHLIRIVKDFYPDAHMGK